MSQAENGGQEGIEEAFRSLYDAELDYVVRTLTRLGVAAADLEDLAHDVFVVAFRKRDERDPSRPARPWLFGIAYRVTGNYLSKARRAREIHDDVDRPDVAPSPIEKLAANQQREQLLGALGALDYEHRVVAVLYDIEGMTAAEIAAVLGIPENTVYSRARAARLKLVRILESEKEESP